MTTTTYLDNMPRAIRVAPWVNGNAPRPMHSVSSEYVERCWLPTLGPSALLFLRYVEANFAKDDGPFLADLRAVAGRLGLAGREGDARPLIRTIRRAVDFGAARVVGPMIEVRRELPELSTRQLARTDWYVREIHESLREQLADAG